MRSDSEIIFSNTTSSAPVVPRGLSRTEAAAYVGLSPSAFSEARKKRIYPNPTLPGGRYDRRLLDQAMNRLSGINSESDATTPLEAWRRQHGAYPS